MKTIAHISDSHFGTVDPAVERALLEDLHTRPPDLMLFTGDVSQRARQRQFRDARAFLDALPAVPRLVIPGNHDIPLFDLLTRLIEPYRWFQRYISAELESTYRDDTVAVLCLNSTRASRHKNGVLSRQQIERVAGELTALPQPFKVVALHHPLMVTLEIDETNRARGADEAIERWINAGADLFLGGHIHLPYCLPVISTSKRQAVVLQAGTGMSRRIRRGVPNSYNRIELQRRDRERHMRLERRDYDAALQRFTVREVHAALSQDGPWNLAVNESP